MIIPPFLSSGDRIRIVSPAGKVQKEKVLPGIELLSDIGFDVIIGKHVFGSHFQYSATDKQRAEDFQEAVNDPETKAIVCARGGYGAVRILDRIDFTPFIKHQKWLVGFSDITVFHSALNRINVASIHGAMPGFFIENKKPTRSFLSLTELLKNGKSNIELDFNDLNRTGNCEGELVGGNLSIIYSLQNTPWQLDTKGKILFIEDVSEYLYHLDRMMHNLKLSGQLQNLAGLIVGGFSEIKDNESPFGKTAYEIIFEAVKDYKYPVLFDFPAGHIPKNIALMFGAKYSLSISGKSYLTLQY